MWKTALDKGYIIQSVVGRGTFGVVVKAISGKDGREVAIKHVQVKQTTYTLMKILRELQIMRHLNSKDSQSCGMDMYFTGL